MAVPCTDCAGCPQPFGIEIFTADGVFIKEMRIPKARTLVPQHSHAYDHTSMLARGSIRMWRDGAYCGEKVAPCGIFIAAGVKHSFLSLEDDTIIYCVHNLHGSEAVEVVEEHEIVGGLSYLGALQQQP